MATSNLTGPGVGLQYPQILFPAALLGAPYSASTNRVTLAPGNAFVLPGGTWSLLKDKYAQVQFYDPISVTWRSLESVTSEFLTIVSDGQDVRVANLLGTVVGAVVTAAGSNYVQSSTTITAASGGATFQAVVGGAVSTTVSITSSGSGYTLPPNVFVPGPPAPGVPAAMIAVIANGTISSITVTDQGAGYQTAPVPQIVPNQFDPALGSIVNGTATTTLTGAGQITAALCTYNGSVLSTAPSLTVGGAGSNATITAFLLQTVSSVSLTSGGAGYGAGTEITTVGGTPAAGAWTNPAFENSVLSPPRPAQIGATQTGGTITSIGTIYDGGLFTGTPTGLVLTGGVVTTAATVGLVLGTANAAISFQQM